MSKVALVTGGAQGIGAEIVKKLSGQGFHVIIGDLQSQKEKANNLITDLMTDSIFVPMDVTNKEDIKHAVDEGINNFGSFDVMVNNAGIAKVDKILDIKSKDFESSYKINVLGVLYGIQVAAQKFIDLNKPGVIINASSIAGIRAFPVWATYSSTKAAVISLTQAAAKELAQYKIRVNAYAPGVVGTTGMWDEIDRKMSSINGKPLGENRKEFIEGIPLGRTVTPTDIANIVGYLASPEAEFITGQALAVDGGSII